MQNSQQNQDLLFSSQCNSSCCDKNMANHSKFHQNVAISVMKQLMTSYIQNQQCPQMQKFHSDFTKLLKQMKQSIDKIITMLDNQKFQFKAQTVLNIKEDQLAKKCSIIINSNSSNMAQLKNIKCSEVNKIYDGICSFQASKKQNTNILASRLDHFGQKVGEIINQHVRSINKTIKDYGASSTSTAQSKPKNSSKQQQNQQQQQIRPSRQAQKTNNATENKKYPNGQILLKISQISKVPGGHNFTVKIKVLSIIKKFRINNYTKISFKGGDQTGTAVFVINQNQFIKLGNTLQITDCFIYLYHGNMKQIQTTRYSKFKPQNDIKKIGTYDLSDNGKHKQQRIVSSKQYSEDRRQRNTQIDRKPRKTDSNSQDEDQIVNRQAEKSQKAQKQQLKIEYSKIKDIEPDSQMLSFIVQVYKIIEIQNKKIVCYLGDQTGVVQAELPQSLYYIKQGTSIQLLHVNAKVIKQHILIILNKQSKVERINSTFPIIKFSNDMSAQEWIEQDDQKQPDGQKCQNNQQNGSAAKSQKKVSIKD